MKNEDLIKTLQQFPPDMEVIIEREDNQFITVHPVGVGVRIMEHKQQRSRDQRADGRFIDDEFVFPTKIPSKEHVEKCVVISHSILIL